MDIKTFRLSVAGLIAQLFVLDANGSPTTTHMTGLAHAPLSLGEDLIPAVGLILSMPARYPVPPDQSRDRVARETRDFLIEFYLDMAEAGVDFQAEETAEPYLDYTRDWLQKHIQLWDSDPTHQPKGVKRTYLVSDTGITSKLRYSTSTVKYLGVAYVVRVDADNEVKYANNQ